MKTNFIKKLFFTLLIFFCWVAIFTCAAAYTFLTTTWGAKLAATYVIESYIPYCKVNVGSYEGTIEKGLLLKDVTLNHILNMKDGSVHIQDIYVQIPLIHWDQISLKIINAKLSFESADPILFNGDVTKNKIQGNCYARSVDAKQVVAALGYEDLAKNIYGFLTNVDFVVDGLVRQPHFSGHFFVDRFVFKNTQVSNGFSHLDLKILSLGNNPSMTGSIIMESAGVKVDKINVDLTTSKVTFKGEVNDFLLDIHGSTKIEDVIIDMSIKGTFQKPKLLFNSDPPMSEEQILVALVTGKSWSGIEDAQGLGLRKKLTEAFNVGMQVAERPSQVGRDQATGYSQTLEGQMNVTDRLSVNVARKFLPSNDTSSTVRSSEPQKDNDSEIYLQYKERF